MIYMDRLVRRYSPPFRDRSASQHLGDTRARARRRVIWHRVEGKETVGDNFEIGRRNYILTEGANDEYDHVVPSRYPSIQENAVELRRTNHLDVALFGKLASKGLENGFAGLHSAARQMPTADIAVLDQENTAVLVNHQSADSKGNPPRKTPIQMQDPPYD